MKKSVDGLSKKELRSLVEDIREMLKRFNVGEIGGIACVELIEMLVALRLSKPRLTDG